ncbi:sigma-70 region 4 domain-containing protein [Oligoflexaceae bacterium]|nr:sigma-70 region 4 domain-containing protein [Oligoflexaceae bacterium]
MVKASMVINDDQLAAFTEKVQTQADDLYRFAYMLLKNEEQSFAVVTKVIEWAAKQLDTINVQGESEVKTLVFKECWQTLKDEKSQKQDSSEYLTRLRSLSNREVAVFSLSDLFGFQLKEVAELMGEGMEDVTKDIVLARKALVG